MNQNQNSPSQRLDYAHEAEQLDTGNYLKLGDGRHEIVFLEEIPAPQKVTRQIKGVEQTVETCDVMVSYKQKVWKFSLNRAKGKTSLWGQLITLAQHWKTLAGKPMHWLVMSGPERKMYTVEEAVALANQEKITAGSPAGMGSSEKSLSNNGIDTVQAKPLSLGFLGYELPSLGGVPRI